MAYGYNPFGGGYGQPPQQLYAQQGYAQQMQGQMMNQQAQAMVNVRMVTSRDEATTAQIPFDGTINVFVNMAAGEVYIKRFNPNTGGAFFDDFIHAEKARQIAQETAKPQKEYATVERIEALEGRVSELAEAMNARKKRGAAADE